MRGPRAVIANVAMLAMLTSGCGSPKGQLFTAHFPAIDGDINGSIDIDALPVTLHDRTGSVVSIVAMTPALDDHAGDDLTRGRADAILGLPNAVRILWLAGACEAHVEMQLSTTEDGLLLIVDAHSQFVFACTALGVSRSVTIMFDRPVAAGEVNVRTDLDVP